MASLLEAKRLADVVRDALPTVPDEDALCHRGICPQSRCAHCQRIIKARRALNDLEREARSPIKGQVFNERGAIAPTKGNR